jgi:hypothetical protein
MTPQRDDLLQLIRDVRRDFQAISRFAEAARKAFSACNSLLEGE